MSEAYARAPDQAARDRALDPADSFIVQAPAGSGKTTLLTQRYLTLLARVERPEAIIAITFTQKAAAEMRERVVDALLRAAAGATPKSPADAQTLVCAAAALAHATVAGWSLVEQPARLRIQTIDSLSHWLAGRLPILSRAGASLKVEPRAAPLYRRAAERTLAELDVPGPLGTTLAVVLAHLGNEAERLCGLIAEMLRGRDRWLRIVLAARGASDEAELRAVLEDSLASLVGSALARARERLPPDVGVALLPLARAAAARLASTRPEFALLADAPPWPLPVDATALPLWGQLTELLLTAKGEWRKKLTVAQGLPTTAPQDKRALAALLERCAAVGGLEQALAAIAALPPARYAETEWRVVSALTTVLVAAAAHLAAVFAEEGAVDFTAVSRAALEALGTPAEPTDLTIALDGRVEHLLVDEFQDTSAAQVSLLERLTAGWSDGDGRTLFLVGDPMQSIYGFREANVGLFLRIRTDGLGGVRLRPLALEANFRSRPHLVGWFNRVFAAVLPDRDAPAFGAVSYASSLPTRGASAEAVVSLGVLPGGDALEEAARVLALVRAEQAANPTARIAVLGRSRAHLTPVATALAAAAIRFQGVDLVPLAERSAVQDLVALTRALLHPADRIAWLACLRAPWCGLELPELERLTGDGQRVIIEALSDEGLLATLGEAARLRLERTRG
ncbi:MAG: UvrD-helicase domain-containing protein, partial [Pseudomonadota bacterium]